MIFKCTEAFTSKQNQMYSCRSLAAVMMDLSELHKLVMLVSIVNYFPQ